MDRECGFSGQGPKQAQHSRKRRVHLRELRSLLRGRTGLQENTCAPIKADGTVGEFNGAAGSNTLQSEGGTNLFNQAHISYVDGDGVAHVMIVGGDDVDSPGNKQKDVLYY